ncbi:hypothetical protein OUZ56_016456 [Daphnia magna]|uniref:Uncharacterized protein n=1 Tax=Daphnia magna TaxID=35525 RepID=A0ABR0AQQ6_9CRUS|nr:hypothetical protein OUZ56_016456 [Daphnia magna]
MIGEVDVRSGERIRDARGRAGDTRDRECIPGAGEDAQSTAEGKRNGRARRNRGRTNPNRAATGIRSTGVSSARRKLSGGRTGRRENLADIRGFRESGAVSRSLRKNREVVSRRVRQKRRSNTRSAAQDKAEVSNPREPPSGEGTEPKTSRSGVTVSRSLRQESGRTVSRIDGEMKNFGKNQV